jgi:hypothetical protein
MEMACLLPTTETMVTMTLFTSAISNVSKSRGLILMTPLTEGVMESLILMGVQGQILSGMLTLVVRPLGLTVDTVGVTLTQANGNVVKNVEVFANLGTGTGNDTINYSVSLRNYENINTGAGNDTINTGRGRDTVDGEKEMTS